ncbi:cytidine deaminase [Candidatus Fermentibacteria bacterium]|nr:cytidine deaminase [Candidatus Fermentibacteria bacterium]
MLSLAMESVGSAYAPYSGVRVAAVIEDASGGLHRGVNMENASYGLSICAERAAAAAAVASGCREFVRALVHSPDVTPVPCGACLQVLAEFCRPEAEILLSGPSGAVESTTLGSLMPRAFRMPGGIGPQAAEGRCPP